MDRIFAPIPIQMCQFHQIQTITKYLTRRPQTEAAQVLRALSLALPDFTYQKCTQALETWHQTYKSYLNERSQDPENGRTWYMHKQLRSAYRSLKSNLQRLFTFEFYPSQNITKTSNALEAHFAALKTYLRCYQGLKMDRKVQFIKDYFLNPKE